MEKEEVPDKCPHCGAKLSPWQKVLLSVDKAIMCKSCWYRIMLDTVIKDKSKEDDDKKGKKDGNL